ncbi:MAG TPA: ATP-binding protein, partial [Acidovorax sp.]|nr:ATP-binding protein [Acidovorax sp.]
MTQGAAAPEVVAVAWSGGRDSTALLHASAHAARALGTPRRIVALHVHHGLQPAADDWLAHCERLAEHWRQQGL